VTSDAAGAKVDSAWGWLVTAAAAVSMFTVFGVAYSFGAFFESITDEFESGSGATAIVFGITISLSFVLGPFTGALSDRIGARPVVVLGAVSLATGLLLTTVAPSIWLAYACYGLGVGLAIACGYVPMVALVGGWFDKRRSFALGVAVAGIGLGTLIAAPLAATLIEATSWRAAFALFAIAGGALLMLAASVAVPGPASQPAPKIRPLSELWTIPTFRILYVSMMCTSVGLFVPFVFIAPYAEEQGNSAFRSALLVGLIGGASVVGRLTIGAIANAIGVARLFRLTFFVMAASQLLWLVGGSSYPILVVFALAFGAAYGGFIALSPEIAADRFGMKGLGGVLGTWYTAAAVGALLGPFFAGVLVDTAGYAIAIGFAGVMLALGWFSLRSLDR